MRQAENAVREDKEAEVRLEQAIALVTDNAYAYEDHTPTLGTLMQEIAELMCAFEGKHEDPPELELVQIGGIVINMLRAYGLHDTQCAMILRDQRKAREATL